MLCVRLFSLKIHSFEFCCLISSFNSYSITWAHSEQHEVKIIQQTKCHTCLLFSLCHNRLFFRKHGCTQTASSTHHLYFLCETFLKLQQGTNLFPVFKQNAFSAEKGHNMPLSRPSSGVTVCSQSIYEWELSSPSCAYTGPPCTSL